MLNAANGQLLYSYVMPGPVYGAVSVARSQFYVGDYNDDLYAFGLPGSTAPPPADPNCPTGFTCQDIRSPAVAGSETTSSGALTVTASGAAIHGTSDQFRFISEPVTGNSQSSVEIVSQSTQNTQPQAGLMVRQSADPTSPYYAVLAYPNDLTEGNPLADIVIWYRSAFGGAALELTKLYPADQADLADDPAARATCSAPGYSTDGVNYQLIPGTTVDIDLPATTLQGIAVDSGSSIEHRRRPRSATLRSGSRSPPTMTPPAAGRPLPVELDLHRRRQPEPARRHDQQRAGHLHPGRHRHRHHDRRSRLVPLRLPAGIREPDAQRPGGHPARPAGHRAGGDHDAGQRLPHLPLLLDPAQSRGRGGDRPVADLRRGRPTGP